MKLYFRFEVDRFSTAALQAAVDFFSGGLIYSHIHLPVHLRRVASGNDSQLDPPRLSAKEANETGVVLYGGRPNCQLNPALQR